MKNDLVDRTRKFAIDCMVLCSKLPKTREYNAYVNQLIRCSSSVGANYRASQRAKSTADFINKLKIVEEELDETEYWIEVISDVELIKPELLLELKKETKELLAIITQSLITKKNKMNN